MRNPKEYIDLLQLLPLPGEGGFYRETYRSAVRLPARQAGNPNPTPRSLSTAIYFALTGQTCAAMHRLPSDELYHFYLGDPVELLRLDEEGVSSLAILGPDPFAGHIQQLSVPARCWQGARLVPGGSFALMGTTVSPGFEFADRELADTQKLARRCPERQELIRALSLLDPPPIDE